MSIIAEIGRRLNTDPENNRNTTDQLSNRNYETLLIDKDDCFLEQRRLQSRKEKIQATRNRYHNANDVYNGNLKSTPEEWVLGTAESSNYHVATSVINKLDITRVTNRILVCGLPTRYASSKRGRTNNLKDLSYFLNTKYSDNYMLWNLAADSSQAAYDCSAFNNQVQLFSLTKAYNFNVKNFLDIFQSIHAWLSLKPHTVAVIHCLDGISKTGLAVAGYLRYADIFQDAEEALDYFCYRRNVHSGIILDNIVSSRYINYLDSVIGSAGRVPYPYVLKLSRVTLNNPPFFDPGMGLVPGIEIYENGKVVASSLRHRLQSPTGVVLQVRQEPSSVIFFNPNEEVRLQNDIQIRFILINVKNESRDISTLTSFSFHTGFMNQGNIEISIASMEFSKHSVAREKFSQNFSVILSLLHSSRASNSSKISYSKQVDRTVPVCIRKLISAHFVQIVDQNRVELELLGYTRAAACIGLQLANNNIEKASSTIEQLLKVNSALLTTFTPQTRPRPRLSDGSQTSKLKSSAVASYHSDISNSSSNRSSVETTNDPTLARAIATAQRLESLLNKSKSKVLNTSRSLQSMKQSPPIEEDVDYLENELMEMDKLISDIKSRGMARRATSPRLRNNSAPAEIAKPKKDEDENLSNLMNEILFQDVEENEVDEKSDDEEEEAPAQSQFVLELQAKLSTRKQLSVTEIESGFAKPVQETQKFEESQGVLSPRKVSKAAKIIPQIKYTTFLPMRRANNISITLISRFRRIHLNDEQLLELLNDINQTTLTADDLVILQSILPTKEELEIIEASLQAFTPESPPFAPAESFLIACSKKAELNNHVLALLYKLQLPVELEAIESNLTLLTNLCNVLTTSEKITTILRAVVQLGSLSNEEYAGGNPAYKPWMGLQAKTLGFQIEGLARLKEVKSLDGSWSLMTLLVEMVQQKETIKEIEFLPDLFQARAIDISEITHQIEALIETGDMLRQTKVGGDFHSSLIAYLDGTIPAIKQIQNRFTIFSNAWIEATGYFGEDVLEFDIPKLNTPVYEKKPANLLFISLETFLSAFQEAINNYTDKQSKHEAAEAREMVKRFSYMPTRDEDQTIDVRIESDYD
ncbi:hypothetical protein HDV04_004310 [Boothiomyces sp. JEL0838]|nr:hypothetical protein HDV04_004310 [Boothiomyces sp. JEL0838]